MAQVRKNIHANQGYLQAWGNSEGPPGICQKCRHGFRCDRARSKRVSEEVIYLLDRQEEFDSPLRETFYELKYSRLDFAPKMCGITSKSKTESLPLQASDLLVGETTESLQNRLYDPERSPRQSSLASS
jgi:hypothetical protein